MYLVAAFYKFTRLDDVAALRARFREAAMREGVRGSLLLAGEGVNGTLAGPEVGLRRFLQEMRRDRRFNDLHWKESWAEEPPFLRLKIRLKREIVSMGAPELARPETVGAYVAPGDWDELIRDPDVVVIDVRNVYETAIGMFEGAIDPKTERFRDFPAWAEAWTRAVADAPPKAVAMYCTGGVRCEKATALMRELGHERVFHLRGGVLDYFAQAPADDTRWRGECFVFDERVSVASDLTPGGYMLCRGCRRPVSDAARANQAFVEGVSCPACAADLTPAQRAARAERQYQVTLADQAGRRHLGAQE